MAGGSTQSAPRVSLITGAGRRIGATTALALARAGYAVVLHANRSRADAEKLAGEIADSGGRASVVLADLADANAVRGLVPAAAAFGPLTLLVNNASQFDEDEIADLDRARFERIVAINLTAPLVLSQAFAAQAPDGADASIVNLVDQRVFKPTPKFFSYTH
jgi:NAD(P)-dependent dehydrogenase (short-subunit alcohol dehydrogenase family)